MTCFPISINKFIVINVFRPHLLPALALLFVLLASGCATTQQNPVKALWLPAEPDAWHKVPASGITLRHDDGTTRHVAGSVISNLVAVKDRLEKASGVRASLGLVDMDTPNAFAFQRQGHPVVAFSLPWLERLGGDVDALATTMGHELAHLHLGHTGTARQQREATAQGMGQLLGTMLNIAGVPLGGTIASFGVAAYARSFTRDEERAADEYGLRWAVAAGYDPCGRTRTMKMYQDMSAGGMVLPFLSTHPGAAERSELANDYSRKTRNRACDD